MFSPSRFKGLAAAAISAEFIVPSIMFMLSTSPLNSFLIAFIELLNHAYVIDASDDKVSMLIVPAKQFDAMSNNPSVNIIFFILSPMYKNFVFYTVLSL